MQRDLLWRRVVCACAGGAVLLPVLLVAGCQTVNGQVYWPWEEPKVDNAREQLAQQQVQQETARSRNQIESLTQSQRLLMERLDRMDAALRDNAHLKDEVAALHRDIDQLRSDRDALRKEIVDDLSNRISKYMATANATANARPPAPAVTQRNGYSHRVVAGQTLTDIAKAYKTTSAAIMKANDMKTPTIRPGQTLFIPE